jgi:DNA-binding MarR family transcriptional regulator
MSDKRPVGFWVKLVDRLIDEQFASTLDEHGVTRRQWQIMNILSRGEASIAEMDAAIAPFLAPATEDSPAESSAEHLTELIESAWVDATTTGYELTERGRAAFDRLEQRVATQRTLISQGVTPEQYEQTIAVLEQVAKNLGYADPAEAQS